MDLRVYRLRAYFRQAMLMGTLTRGTLAVLRSVIVAATAVRGIRESLTGARLLGILGSGMPLV